ncbi:hypothetical protein HDU80_003370, partial [Chytriomyces hyalinus]
FHQYIVQYDAADLPIGNMLKILHCGCVQPQPTERSPSALQHPIYVFNANTSSRMELIKGFIDGMLLASMIGMG